MWGLTMSSVPGENPSNSQSHSGEPVAVVQEEEVMEKKRWEHEFDTGWYLQGIEDPEIVKHELDPDEEKKKPTTEELYRLLVRLAGLEDEVAAAEPSSQS